MRKPLILPAWLHLLAGGGDKPTMPVRTAEGCEREHDRRFVLPPGAVVVCGCTRSCTELEVWSMALAERDDGHSSAMALPPRDAVPIVAFS